MDCFNKINNKLSKSVILFHGGNMEVENPMYNYSRKMGDFGKAFYLTENKKQAEKWAIDIKNKRGGNPVVNVYRCNLENLSIKELLSIDEDWADYISKGRTGGKFYEDVIYGYVADDTVWEYTEDYLTGLLDLVDFLKKSKFMIDKTQYAFRTEKSVSKLKFLYSYEVM